MTNALYLWVFKQYSDSTDSNTRYGRQNLSAEYGISSNEFAAVYYDDAIADGKDYWEKLSSEKKDMIKESFIESKSRELENIVQQIKEVAPERYYRGGADR